MDRAPHYLRVVQALALVSGFGAVAFVGAVNGCSDSSAPLVCSGICSPEDAAPPYCGQGGICNDEDGSALGHPDVTLGVQGDGSVYPDASDANTDATVADGSDDAAGDAKADVTTDGGPLPPPDLPA